MARSTSRSVSYNEDVPKRSRLDRTISMDNEKIPMSLFPKYQTATPTLMSRWRSSRSSKNDKETILEVVSSEEDSGEYTVMGGDSPPQDDDMVYSYESFEDVSEEELQVKIVKDQLRQSLVELMRAHGGNVHALDDIEKGHMSMDAIRETFSRSTTLEKNVALLWSAFTAQPELTSVLLECGGDMNYCEPQQGFSALHLSAFSGCLATTRLLLAEGADPNYALKSYTPLHSAAFGNSASAAQLLLDHGARFDVDGNCDSAVHCAIKANSGECVRLLAKRCSNINLQGGNGMAPLHVAAELGHTQCLQALLDVEGIDSNIKTRDKKNTPLHLAAESGTSDCLAMLLARGADPAARNGRGQTPLHLAARAQSIECVETLLKTTCCDVNALDNEQRSPLHAAVTRSASAYDIVEALIARRADVNKRDKYGYTPLHLAASNELSQCVEALIYYGADVTARTKGGTTALGIIVRKIPASLQVFYNKLDSSISLHDPEHSNKEVELKLDFRCILQHCLRGEISFLNTFIDEGQKEILEHPLCEAFLHLKWEKIRKLYGWRLVFSFLFVLSLTGYVMSGLAWNCYNVGKQKVDTESPLCPPSEQNGTWIGSLMRKNPSLVEYQWYVLVGITILEILRKLLGIAAHTSVRQYWAQFENVFEWLVVASVFAVSCVYNSKTFPWQNHVAAFAVLISWTNFMVKIGQLPLLGSYVAMFTKVQREFAKLLLAYLCMLIGFTLSFCVIFPGSQEFANPFIGFIKVLVMMTGELDLDLILKPVDQVSLLTFSAYVIFVVFLLMVTVVLMNLLVGIAVNDIQGLKKTAGLSKLVSQTKLISYIELALFNGYFPASVLHILNKKARVCPSGYCVALHVKPLNPRERRLPKDTLRAAYELAKSRKTNSNTLSAYGSNATYSTVNPKFRRNSIVYNSDRARQNCHRAMFPLPENEETIAKLGKEVEELKEMVKMNQILLQKALDALHKK